jgi:hypothetical protein
MSLKRELGLWLSYLELQGMYRGTQAPLALVAVLHWLMSVGSRSSYLSAYTCETFDCATVLEHGHRRGQTGRQRHLECCSPAGPPHPAGANCQMASSPFKFLTPNRRIQGAALPFKPLFFYFFDHILSTVDFW